MDEYLNRYPNERIIQRSQMKKNLQNCTIYVMQVIQVGFYKFMACFQRLERYISERSAMRRIYIVGLAISRAKYYCLHLSVNYNSLSYLI